MPDVDAPSDLAPPRCGQLLSDRPARRDNPTMTVQRPRLPYDVGAGVLTVAVLVLALVSRSVAVPVPGTSYAVLASTLVAAATCLAGYLTVERGWVLWRQVLLWLALVVLVQPALWAAAVLSSQVGPGGTATWGWAVLATTGHLPVLAAFSLLPLLCMRYLGRGTSRILPAVVVTLGIVAFAAFALFFDDFAPPLETDALVDWSTGATLGAAANSLFLATVLIGPVGSLLAAWRADGEAARRLALVAVSALTGCALVMLCAAVAELTPWAGVLVSVAMHAALVVLVVGCSRALLVPEPSALPGHATPREDESGGESRDGSSAGRAPSVAALTARECEILALLAEGLSNAGIAARLVVSDRTVDAHLRSVFTKLDLPQGPHNNRRVHAVNAWRGTNPARGLTEEVTPTERAG